MFDSQKLSFRKFITSYKHGIYVFTRDACHICTDYKQSIEYINNAYLYFVEVITSDEEEIVGELLQRHVFPLTACFKDNKLKYVKAGQLFDLQLEDIFKDLKEFGDNPLSQSEINERIKKEQTKCKLSYYCFAPDCTETDKSEIMKQAIKYNELPIDIDTVGIGLTEAERLHMLEGNLPFAKLVLFKKNSGIFTPITQKLLIMYTQNNESKSRFEVRNINEVLVEKTDDSNNSNIE